ncbi:MAG: hypothetical protein A3F82_10405 [Deltaproteobacteria bacterium RIFCSPLOWO2_12_FULL_44_12]|nr:MAG: hypothetical protein A2712_07665 [Deltaproteobacteria bacterium RIFCSPHIGHO2_01_FULL_43_49]OGQ14780.1 MAG: hypothetical protein A3D22_09330 [Deltaproteobacteria bacterium RIFCSPHIGHO2_02_FULL_44_53]OGQ28166.1 MAG: hypothetical protein A3D98_08040 [Deltaproteobacteria bacterium RIFCSPHIGHO2_12_FULL_44_21]OGQ31378.1 MAG: hypothetical protein A2979_08090 [Deltaproteobacteria bacterium RIFCSPLOWO2_01_FULL_45_74]OGQ43370.1 MAG: hypothetical protein A3I70_01750 [Deltaproteobacteria bacterium 
MRDYTQAAIEIAKEAGALQMDRLHKQKTISYKDQNKFNIVTEVDKACEKLICDYLKDKFPSHDILAEEGSGFDTKSDWLWIIDPIDGTVNYAHGYPLFSVSIGLLHKGKVVVGVVYEPNLDELFVGERGGGAVLNDKPIRVSKNKALDGSMIATGFAYNVNETRLNNIDHFNNFILKCHAVRRDGVASTDLCYIACGRFDGFWELFLKPWDIAAASVIVEEAGGKLSMFDGRPLDIFGNEIVANNGLIHEEMLQILKSSDD